MTDSETQKREELDSIAKLLLANLLSFSSLKTGNDIIHVLMQAIVFLHKRADQTGRIAIEQSVRNLMVALYKAE